MNRKLKQILKSLEASPEIKEKKCVKEVQQLRSAYARFEVDDGLSIDTLRNRISKLCVHLQTVVSDPVLIQGLRKIQRECQKMYNDMVYEDSSPDIDYSLCMCKDDY